MRSLFSVGNIVKSLFSVGSLGRVELSQCGESNIVGSLFSCGESRQCAF